MYGRQPQPQYPRQYGHGYPQQPPYPPQQPPYAPQQPQYPPHQGGYPPQQAPRGPPSYGAQYGAPAPPRPGCGAPVAPPVATPPPRPYGARAPSPAVSTYESQAQRWKKGFTPGANGGGASRQSDVEAPLIAELCSSAGSSYPPRDVLQKLLRHLPSLDHEYVCELLDDKLEDRLWQVQGKALSVLDALFKSTEAETYKTHYYHKIYILEALCGSRKELLKARAEKVFNVVKSFVPPNAPVEQPMHQSLVETASMLPTSPIVAPASSPDINLLGSPTLEAVEAPSEAPASSAFGFLNSTIGAPPVSVPVSAPLEPVEAPAVSAFSFLSSQISTTQAPVVSQQPLTRVVAVAPASAVAPTDIFSALPPPTPVVGLATPQEPAPAPVEEEPKVHDPIHDAFEGLSFGDDDDDKQPTPSPSGDIENPLEGFSTTSRGTMGGGTGSGMASKIKIEASDPIREVILEIDVPAGPMGLMLDRSIPHMAVLQGFLPMPTGERGYLELHPVLCPGCALVSINSINVEDKGLEEVGAILGSLIGSYKVLQFKKLMRSGRTVNPANPDVVYIPPPPEESEPAEDEKEPQGEDDTESSNGDDFMKRLTGYSDLLDDVENQINELVLRDRANLPVGDMKNQLAQLHGNVEKIQTQGIDAVILGANPPANADEIRQLRSSLVRRADAITKRIQKIATQGTAPSPEVGVATVGSPEVSAFSFVGDVSGMPPMPPLELPQSVPAPPPSSAFSFMHSTPSPATSPVAASTSAFSFMSNTSAPATSSVSSNDNVFAGLSLRNSDPAPQSAPEPEPASAFGFLSGPSTVREPPRIGSPTAFSFLKGGPSSPPPSPTAPSVPGCSAFSFIAS